MQEVHAGKMIGNSTKHNLESRRGCREQTALPAGQAAFSDGPGIQESGAGALNANSADLFIKEGAEEGDMRLCGLSRQTLSPGQSWTFN